MVKVIFLLQYRSDLEREAVSHWWRTAHGSLALRNLGMKRYVQNHWQAPIDSAHAEGGLSFDGCVEVWFEDMEAYERTMASDEWKALEADGYNGFDMTTQQGGFVTEHVMRWEGLPDGRIYTTAGQVPGPKRT